MPFPFSLQKKQTPPKGASPLNGDIAPARGQQVDEKVNKPLQRHEANVDTFGSVCGLHPTDLAMYCLNDKLGAWRLYTMPSDARPPVNAREQARLPADAPWEPWHDLPPLREGVPAPDWGPKPENVRGFNDRNFIGPLESTHTMYEVDTLYFPVMPPRRSWWKVWQRIGTRSLATLLIIFLFLVMVLLIASNSHIWDTPPLHRRGRGCDY